MNAKTRERGFTLIELLVAVTILGVLSIAIGSIWAVMARSSEGTMDRLTQSRGPKVVGAYWTPDVNGSETVNPSGAVCGSSGTPLVSFLWRDDRYGNLLSTWSTVTSGSTATVARTRCTVEDGVVSSPVQTNTIAQNLAPPSATQVRCGAALEACAADSTPDRVVITLTTEDGRSFDVEAARKVKVS
jgi:prepilin-type N-terminal cleavage/methylation domain-containing protein